jgi:hypothetical protein
MATNAVLDEQAEQELRNAEEAEAKAEAKRQARGDYVDDEQDPEALSTIAEDDDKPHEKAVPYARFNEVAADRDREREDRLRIEGERDALQRQLEGRGTGEPAKKTEAVDVEALRDQANEAMIEGDTEKANTLRRQANAAERAQLLNEAEERAVTRIRAEEGQREILRAAAAVIKDYPFLDSNNAAEKDPEAIEQVVALRDTYMRTKGMTAGEALTKAAERVGKLVLRERAIAANDDDEPAGKRRDPAADRSTQAIIRGASAAARQPAPPIGGKGDRAAQARDPDPTKMTDAEFDKLTPAEKSRLRGDNPNPE